MAKDKPLEYYYDLIQESEKLIAECKLTREREILNQTNISLLEYKIITAKALIKKKIALRMLRAELARAIDD